MKIAVRFRDLGDWGDVELRSEYDPAIPEIRVNTRYLASVPLPERRQAIASAVGHELYHHYEAVGSIAVLRDRGARETAANEFAKRLLERDA